MEGVKVATNPDVCLRQGDIYFLVAFMNRTKGKASLKLRIAQNKQISI